MAEVTKPLKVGNVWTNLIDSNSGDSPNFEIREYDLDGSTPLTDEKCDGVLYRKTPDGDYVIDTEYITTSVINVKKFGAKGDGTTDDTAAIQAALDSAPNKGIVYFPAGVYDVYNQINLPVGKELILMGVGRRSSGGVGWSNYNGISMIRYMGTDPSDTACMKSEDDSWQGVIKYLGIYNASGRDDVDGVSLANFRSCTIETVFIRQFKINLSIDGNGWYGLLKEVTLLDAHQDNFYMTGIPNGMTFRDCRISRAVRHGVYYLDARSDVHFYNCYLENNGGNAIRADRALVINIAGSHFESNSESWTSALDDVDRVHIKAGRGPGDVTHSTSVNITSCHFFTAPAINIVGLYSPTGSITSKIQLLFQGNSINTKTTTAFGTDTFALITDGLPRAFIGVFVANISMQEPVGRIGDVNSVDDLYRYSSLGCELSAITSGAGDSRMASGFSDIRVNRLWLPPLDGGGVGGTGNGCFISAGTEHPEDNVEAPQSSLYIRSNQNIPIEDRLFIKESGALAAGWKQYKSQRVKTITSGDADDFEDGSLYLIKASDISNVANLPNDAQDMIIQTFVESDGDVRSRQIAYGRRGRVHVRSGSITQNNKYEDGWTELGRALVGGTTGRPAIGRPTGTQYFDTDLGHPVWWDGTDWVNALPDIPNATTTTKGLVNQMGAIANVAVGDAVVADDCIPLANANKAKIDQILIAMRSAGMLDT